MQKVFCGGHRGADGSPSFPALSPGLQPDRPLCSSGPGRQGGGRCVAGVAVWRAIWGSCLCHCLDMDSGAWTVLLGHQTTVCTCPSVPGVCAWLWRSAHVSIFQFGCVFLSISIQTRVCACTCACGTGVPGQDIGGKPGDGVLMEGRGGLVCGKHPLWSSSLPGSRLQGPASGPTPGFPTAVSCVSFPRCKCGKPGCPGVALSVPTFLPLCSLGG